MLRSLRLRPDVKRGSADYAPVLDRLLARYQREDIATYGLAHLNSFASGQLLPVLREVVDGLGPEPLKGLVEEATARLRLEVARDGVSMTLPGEPKADHRFPPHGYLTYWALVSLAAWSELDEVAAGPSLRWSETELYRQIALFTTGNDERSDAYQLGYNRLVQHRFNRIGLGDSLIDLGLRTLFSAQLERGCGRSATRCSASAIGERPTASPSSSCRRSCASSATSGSWWFPMSRTWPPRWPGPSATPSPAMALPSGARGWPSRRASPSRGPRPMEPELRRQPYRKNIALATRSEMTRLVQELKGNPDRAEQLLSTFRAELADDPTLDQEAAYNSFDRRT